MAEIVVVGAGLTGLSTAYHLEKLGFFDYKIFDKNGRPGGLLQSTQQDGFTFDYTGHLLHISDPNFFQFLDTVAGINNFHLVERKTGIFSHNVTTDYPFQINLFGLPIDVAAECIEGYVKRSTHIKKPTNFHDWVLKHFGAGLGKHFFFPYNKKLLACDLKKIHPSWTGRFVPSTSLQAIIKGTIEKKPPAGIGYNSSFYYPKKDGIEFIIKQVASKIANRIQVNHQVAHIDTMRKIVFFSNGHQEPYRYLVSTMPLNHLLTTCSTSTQHTLQQAAPKLLCNAVVNINLGFSVDSLLPMHWIYFPEKVFPFYRLGFWHNVSPASVPAGNTAIYGEFAYLPNTTPEQKKSSLIAQTRKKILEFLKLQEHHVVCEKVLHLPHAYVTYDMWREKNLPKLLTQLKTMDIYSTGRYGAWKYSSMQEAFLDGKGVAETLHALFQPTIMPARRDTTILTSTTKTARSTIVQ